MARAGAGGVHEQIISLLWQAASQVPDPELPFLEIGDLGILRDIRIDGETFIASVSPTYTGCPAVAVIEERVVAAMQGALDDATDEGLLPACSSFAESSESLDGAVAWKVGVERQLSPAWTTDWISDEGHRKLKANGIAPPVESGLPTTAVSITAGLFATLDIDCPHCGSAKTERLSEFGSTPCKSQHRCLDCREPFDHFKCLR